MGLQLGLGGGRGGDGGYKLGRGGLLAADFGNPSFSKFSVSLIDYLGTVWPVEWITRLAFCFPILGVHKLC